MAKNIILFCSILLAIICSAQNDSIQKTGKYGTEEQEQRAYKLIIEDFISASEKDPMFGNGLWMTIGKQNTDEDILKAGFKDSYSRHENIRILKSMDHENYHYILFSTQKKGKKLI